MVSPSTLGHFFSSVIYLLPFSSYCADVNGTHNGLEGSLRVAYILRSAGHSCFEDNASSSWRAQQLGDSGVTGEGMDRC